MLKKCARKMSSVYISYDGPESGLVWGCVGAISINVALQNHVGLTMENVQ